MKTDYLINAVVAGAVLAIPAGLTLQYFYPDGWWWLMSAAGLIFFMAG